MNSPSDHEPRETRWDESDPLWRLLGESPHPEPDAWFATRALARCRQAGAVAESAGASFSRLWRWAFGGGLGVCLAVTLMVVQVHSTAKTVVQQKNVQEAFEIMASLPATDSDSTSSSSWQDSSR